MICLDHAGGWSTQYADLAHVLATPTDRFRRRRKTRVRASDVLGHARTTRACACVSSDWTVLREPNPRDGERRSR
jgi:hypothetical protein